MFGSLFNQNIIILLIILNLEFFVVLRGLNLLLKFHLFFFFLNVFDFQSHDLSFVLLDFRLGLL